MSSAELTFRAEAGVIELQKLPIEVRDKLYYFIDISIRDIKAKQAYSLIKKAPDYSEAHILFLTYYFLLINHAKGFARERGAKGLAKLNFVSRTSRGDTLPPLL